MATDNGDGTFTIRFYNAGVADYVTVDKSLATTSSGAVEYAGTKGNELWVALIEKAYVQINEEGWLGHAASNSYAAIDGGYSDLAISQITGAKAGWKWATSTTAANLIANVAAGKYTVLGSRLTNPGNGVIAGHGYSLIGYNGTTGQFTLYNPWGSTINLTWSQIQQSFNGFWQAL
jgi:predicted small integral membrane protein